MKNRRKAAFIIIIMAVLLAACGINSDKNVTSGEMVVPEMSSEDLLVTSLEYLLLNDEDTSDQEEQEIAGQELTAQEQQDIQDQEAGEAAVIYYGDGGSVALKQETIEVETVSPDELINALARHNIVSLDTKVLSFEQGEEDGAAILYLDLSKAAGEYLRTMSKEAECIIVAAIVDTFLENFDADAVYITIEGATLATSNGEYTESIEQCTPEELLKILKASVTGK